MRLRQCDLVRRGMLGAAALVVGAAAGCGWSARDEFYLSRGVTLRPEPGNGSELTWNARSTPGYRTAGAEVASRWEER